MKTEPSDTGIGASAHADEILTAHSEEIFRGMLESAPYAVLLVNEAGRIVLVNAQAETLFGYRRDELLEQPIENLVPEPFRAIHPTHRHNYFKELRSRPMAEGRDVFGVRKNGSTFPVEISLSPLIIKTERYVIGVVNDITKRKRAEYRMAAQHAVTRVLASSPHLMDAGSLILQAICEALDWDTSVLWRVDSVAQLLRCVQTWQKPSLHSKEFELVTRDLTFASGVCLPGLVWSRREPQWIANVVQSRLFERAPFAAKLGLHGGLAFPILFEDKVLGVIEFFSHQIKPPDEDLLRMMAGVGSQIGQFIERKRTEEGLREAQAHFHKVISSSPTVLFILAIENDQVRGISWMSHNVFDMLGYPESEIRGTDWWTGHVHPDEVQSVVGGTQQDLLGQGFTTQEYRFRHRDGKYRWVRAEIRLLRDAAGKATEAVGSWSDITERKLLEEQYRQAQKMEAVGRLAGGIAHDFNNLLTVIMGYSDIYLDKLRPEDPLRVALTEIHKAGARAAGLTRQLLAFSRKQVLMPAVLDLNAILADMQKMLPRLIGEDIAVTFVAGADLWQVKADPGQMEQVVMNIIVNARDAMPQGGKLLLETKNVELDNRYVQRHSYAKSGEHVLLAISDSGCGMDAAVKAHIFEPFFTTKGPTKGTGLGLATVFGIVKQSGGHIDVYSEVGQGTTFKIYLPRNKSSVSMARPPQIKAPVRGGKETILLVEDEDGVRFLAQTVLRQHGYNVLEARNGGDALLICETHAKPIDLMITDVVMPHFSGRELAERLAPRQPTMVVLFMSGYTDDAIVHHGVLESGMPFLQKPFAPEALARKVRDVLDAARAQPPG